MKHDFTKFSHADPSHKDAEWEVTAPGHKTRDGAKAEATQEKKERENKYYFHNSLARRFTGSPHSERALLDTVLGHSATITCVFCWCRCVCM